MDYQVSARKYRPSTFDDVIGQPHIVQTLLNAVSTKRIAHAYLFSGTRGVGKTTVARILAKALNCEEGPTGHPCNRCPNCQEIMQGSSVDVVEIDGASNTSVDDVREIRENVKFSPFRGQYRVYIIDEVHMLSNSAFNALLKTLEEPPGHVVFIFATTEIHKIPATILSRCQHYNFRRIAQTEIMTQLRHVAEQEQITLEERSLVALARASEGSLRDALSLLDQAVAFGGKTIEHHDLEVLLGAVPHELVQGLINAVMAQNSPAALTVLASLLDQGHDLRAFCANVVEQFRHLLVASVVPAAAELRSLIEASEEDLLQLTTTAKGLSPEQLQDLLTIFTKAEDSLRLSTHPRFVMEAAAIRATRLLRPQDKGPARPLQASPAPVTSGKKPPARPEAVEPPSSVSRTARPDDTRTQPAQASYAAPTSGSSSSPIASDGSPISAPPSQLSANEQTLPSATVPPESTPVDGPDSLDWEAIQEDVAASLPNIAPFLEAGRFLGITQNLVTIGFAKQATLARTRLEKEDNLLALAKLCQKQSGHPVRIRIVELSETDSQGPTMAQVRAAKEEDQRLILFQQARAHPTVKQALTIFGAELAEVRRVPQKEVTE